eukprot:718311-Rhodomonas_salina.2
MDFGISRRVGGSVHGRFGTVGPACRNPLCGPTSLLRAVRSARYVLRNLAMRYMPYADMRLG